MIDRKALISGIIGTVLSLQAMAAFQITPGPIERSPWLWPFLDYPMYATPHYPGDSIQRPAVHGVLEDASEVRIEPSDLGFDFWWFRRGLIFDLLGRDTSRIRGYAELYADRQGRSLEALRLYYRPVVIDEAGFDTLPTVRVRSIPVRQPPRP